MFYCCKREDCKYVYLVRNADPFNFKRTKTLTKYTKINNRRKRRFSYCIRLLFLLFFLSKTLMPRGYISCILGYTINIKCNRLLRVCYIKFIRWLRFSVCKRFR